MLKQFFIFIILSVIIYNKAFCNISTIDTSKVSIKMKYPYLRDTPMGCVRYDVLVAFEIVKDSVYKYKIKKFDFFYSKPNSKSYYLNCKSAFFSMEIKDVLTNEIMNYEDLEYGYFTNIVLEDEKTKEEAILKRKVYLNNLR